MENISRRIPVDPPGSLASIKSADPLNSLSSQCSLELAKAPPKEAKAPPKLTKVPPKLSKLPPKEAGISGSFPTPNSMSDRGEAVRSGSSEVELTTYNQESSAVTPKQTVTPPSGGRTPQDNQTSGNSTPSGDQSSYEEPTKYIFYYDLVKCSMLSVLCVPCAPCIIYNFCLNIVNAKYEHDFDRWSRYPVYDRNGNRTHIPFGVEEWNRRSVYDRDGNRIIPSCQTSTSVKRQTDERKPWHPPTALEKLQEARAAYGYYSLEARACSRQLQHEQWVAVSPSTRTYDHH